MGLEKQYKGEKKKQKEFIFIDKTVFFPKHGILAIGDLHLGYEQMLRELGILVPEFMLKDIKENLKRIISNINKKGFKLREIVFLGDIKHFFGYEKEEKYIFKNILKFLEKYVNEENIILIKGNHDTFDFCGKKMENYYIKNNIVFVHGHKSFKEIFDKKVSIIIMAHIHPSVILSEKKGAKREKFKCFLIGNFRGKKIVILPSFFEIVEGINVNDYIEEYENHFSIIPRKSLLKFKVFVFGDDEKVYDFGMIKDLK